MGGSDLIREVDYLGWDAVAAAEHLAAGDISPGELLEAALARRDRVNPVVNAVVSSLQERAERRVGDGFSGSRFGGVPFLLKNLGVHIQGEVTSHGSHLFRDWVADFDSELTRRYEAAGLLIFGRTNTPDMGLNITTEPVLHGPTLNPWDTAFSTGGSSGGAAAAVASGIVPVAHASDGGGSIRIPASCCGLFGLKVSRGRTPQGPKLGDQWAGLVVNHVVSRSVRDSAAVLDATAGAAPGDPYASPPTGCTSYEDATSHPRSRRLRIAFSPIAESGAPVEQECLDALQTAVDLCESLGHDVSEVPFRYDSASVHEAYKIICGSYVLVDLQNRWKELGREAGPDDIEGAVWRRSQFGNTYTAADHARAVRTIQMVGRSAGEFFEQFDVYITPTLAQPPQEIGYFNAELEDIDEFQRRVWKFMPFTVVWSATGLPAASVPLHWTDNGLPVGVQFTARLGDEVTLFELAGQLEQAAPWSERFEKMMSTIGS